MTQDLSHITPFDVRCRDCDVVIVTISFSQYLDSPSSYDNAECYLCAGIETEINTPYRIHSQLQVDWTGVDEDESPGWLWDWEVNSPRAREESWWLVMGFVLMAFAWLAFLLWGVMRIVEVVRGG